MAMCCGKIVMEEVGLTVFNLSIKPKIMILLLLGIREAITDILQIIMDKMMPGSSKSIPMEHSKHNPRWAEVILIF